MKQILINNIFMIILVTFYSVFSFRHLYRFKKYSGKKVKEYTHRSSVKIMGYIMIALGIFYTFVFFNAEKKSPTNVVTFLLFIYFIILVSWTSIKNIALYENGLLYSGKFILYSEMDTISKVGKKGVQVTLQKKGLSNMLYMSRIEAEKDLIQNVKKRIKLARKNKKIHPVQKEKN